MPATVLVDAQAVAAGVNRPVSTVYRWAKAGLLHPKGKDHVGRVLYDLGDALTVSKARPPRRPKTKVD